MSTWSQEPSQLLEILKKISIITGSILINTKIKDNIMELKAGFNQHLAYYKLPVEYTGDELKFCFKADVLKVFLSGAKQSVKFKYENNSLEFRSGRSKGSIATLPYEDFEVTVEDAQPINKELKDFIFDNLYQVKFLEGSFSKDSTLRVGTKDSKIKMMVFEDSYGGVINRPIGTKENLTFDLSLYYASLIVDNFKKEDDIEISVNTNIVGIKASNCILILPRKVDSNDFTLELEEEDYRTNIIPEKLKSAFIIPNKSEILSCLNELKSFSNLDGRDGSIEISSKEEDGNATIFMEVKTKEGNLSKTLEKVKVNKEFKAYIKIEPLIFALNAIVDGTLKLANYGNRILLKSNNDQESHYQFWNSIQ